MARKRTTRTTKTTTAKRITRRSRRSVRTIDLGSRPVLTLAAWFGICSGVTFLIFAIFGTSVWSDQTLTVVPVKLALLLAFGLFMVAGVLFAGLQFGWFEGFRDTPVRRTRRSSSSTRRTGSSRRSRSS